MLVFVVWIILFIFQSAVQKKVSKMVSRIVSAALLVIAIAGLLFSYSDFNNTMSHRWLGTRFHLGVYLFWIGWIAISVFLLLGKKTAPPESYKPENLG